MVLSTLIIHCWAIFAQTVWPRHNKAQTLIFEVIFIFKEPGQYILPFLADNLGIINGLDKTKREKDEDSCSVKDKSEREKGLGLG